MMTREHRRHRFVSGTVSARTVQVNPSNIGTQLIVPRNTRAHLIKMHGSIAPFIAALTDADTIAFLALVEGGLIPTQPFDRWKTLWSHICTHRIVGIPANQALDHNGADIEVDLSERIGNDMKSQGARSNVQSGWQLMGQSTANFAIGIDLTLEYQMEWLGGPSSRRGLNDQEQMWEENQ